MKERENMPEISAAARKTLNQQADYIKQYTNPKQNKVIIDTCKTCNKQYNQEETNQIISELPAIANFDYDKQCLNCIKKISQNMKTSYRPDLKEAKESLAELTITYQKAHKHYKTLSIIYQKYDYQENMINHHLTKPTKKPKASTTKKKKTDAQIKKATAMKILSNLTEEQQAAILALIAKQETVL